MTLEEATNRKKKTHLQSCSVWKQLTVQEDEDASLYW